MKKILIFTCIGGHTLTSNALQNYLSSNYEIVTSDILETLPIDHTLRSMTRNSVCAGSVYSFFCRYHLLYMLSKCIRIFYWYLNRKKKQIACYIQQHIARHHPDMIISVIPFFNDLLLQSAQHYNIPFILAPTDFEISHFLYGISTSLYEKFHICLAFDSPFIQKTLQDHGSFPHVHVTGPILRPDFFVPKDNKGLRKKWHIKPGVPVILLMMGSEGAQDIIPCMKQLLEISCPVHIFCLLGKYTELQQKVKNFFYPSHITCTVLGFTHDVADIMAVSDIFVAKPGGMSTFEALISHLPMMLYCVNKLPFWEQPNAQFILDNCLGSLVCKLDNLAPLIENMLATSAYVSYKAAFERIPHQDGGRRLESLVKSMI
ncbi:MAG TPA: glycosyltransferase [Candidatus Bathyarchaeia archaeon]|nr:glycosyltransferase [Candidatus Bathyarchaeia archaeon]